MDTKTNRKRRIFRILQYCIIIYCSIGIALYYLQEKFLFHPVVLSSDHRYMFSTPFEEFNVPFNEEDTMNMLRFYDSTKPRKGAVLFYHGNMENINHYASYAPFFTSRGYECWMPDYPGYGKSRGKRTEKKMYEFAEQAYRMAAVHFPADSILIYGKSLGTGIAAYVGSYHKAFAMVLETPYNSIPDLFANYAFIYPVQAMSTYKIPTATYLEDFHGPVIMFHGTSDGVIRYSQAEKLERSLGKKGKLITIEGGSHNNLATYPRFTQVMDSLLRR